MNLSLSTKHTSNHRYSMEGKRTPFMLFGISLLIVLAAFMPMLLRDHYSTDSYHLLKDQHTTWYLQCGRYTFWAFAYIFKKLQINLVLAQRWFIAFCLLSLAVCAAVLTSFLQRLSGLKNTAQGTFLVLPVALIWCNVFLEDWMLFPEVAGMIALSAIGLTASILIFFHNDSILSLVLSALLLLLTLGAYQSMVGSYIAATVIVSCLKYGDDTRAKLTSSIKGIVVAGICAVLNIAILKAMIASGFIVESGRGSTFDIQTILANLMQVAQYQASFWKDADGLLFCPIMQLLEIALIVLFTLAFRQNTKNGLAYLLAFIIALGTAYAPHYVEATICLSPRSNVAVWAALGFMLSALWCDCFTKPHSNHLSTRELENEVPPKRRVTPAIACMLIIFSALSFIVMWDISYDVYVSNVQDRTYATSIGTAIHDYESASGITVRKIGVIDDASPTLAYQETRYKNHELGLRIMSVLYSRVELINWINNLDLKQVDVSTTKANEPFGNANWDNENLSKQLRFEDDIAYLTIY